MLTRSNCKICDSPWHSKNKCPKRENRPLKAVYPAKRDYIPFETKNPSYGSYEAHKANTDRSPLIREADRVFSLYIRQRGMNSAGNNFCFTCGIELPWRQLQCGHFVSRRFTNTRWHELNCWPQCNDCNVNKHGNLKVYEVNLIDKFGKEAIEELKVLSRVSKKVFNYEIEELTKKYKGIVF